MSVRRAHRPGRYQIYGPPEFLAEVRYRMTDAETGFAANVVVRNGVVDEVDAPQLLSFVGQGSQLILMHAGRENWRTELIRAEAA